MIYWISFYFIEGILLFARGRRSYILMVAFSILFSGLRYENGNDWFNYCDILENIDRYRGHVEWGFFYLGKLFNLLPFSEHFLFFSFSFATLGLMGLSFHRIMTPRLAFLLYLLTPGLFLNSFHVIRQMLAVSLFFYAVVQFSKETKYKLLFLFCGILGVSFHYTAIIPFVFFLVIYRFPMRANLLPCVSAAALVFCSSIISATKLPLYVLEMFSDSKFEIYSKVGDVENGLKILVINLIATSYIYGYYRYKSIKDGNYLKLFVFGVVLLNLFSDFSVVTRVSYYFIPFGLVLFCNLTDRMAVSQRFVFRSLYVALYGASTILAFLKLESLQVSGSDYPSLLNYNSIFSK